MSWFKRQKTGRYDGPVVFANGSHYPVNWEGHAVMGQRLLWNADQEAYFWARDDDPTHQHLYETGITVLPVNVVEERHE